MQNLVFSSDRQFQVWKYTVGHSQLLLRSVKSTDYPTRVDVLFKGVAQFHLPTVLEGLFIVEESEIEGPALFSLRRPASYTEKRKVYTVKGRDFVGYVPALVAFTHEDEGEYYDPSHFASLKGL